jgi:NADH dehydrogenase
VILIAGGTGRLGTLLVHQLTDRGLAIQRARRLPHNVDIAVGDVRDPDALLSAVHGMDTVVSAVQGFAGPGNGTPASVDRDGNIHLIDAAQTVNADFVMVSVVGAAADSPMELFRMKHTAEEHLRSTGLPATIVQATAFRELWVELMNDTAGRSGRPLVFGRGNNPINFVSVNEVAALTVKAITDPATRGSTLHVGGPDNLTFNQLAEAVQNAAGRTKPPRHIPPAGLLLMANTVGRFRPELRRQARAALVMDRLDLTYTPSLIDPGTDPATDTVRHS